LPAVLQKANGQFDGFLCRDEADSVLMTKYAVDYRKQVPAPATVQDGVSLATALKGLHYTVI
jgi:hypothetical protein